MQALAWPRSGPGSSLCGWKTDPMFRRYAIVDSRDRAASVALLAADFGGDQRGRAHAVARYLQRRAEDSNL
jgi:hypothetical protein